MTNWDFAIDTRNYGQRIRNIRKAKGIKQEVLAQRVSMSQQAVSRYEQMEIIDDHILVRFAKALGVTTEYIKEYQEDAKTIIVENNTFENNKDSVVSNVGCIEGDAIYNNNPLDKIVELFEKLLDTEKEKVTLLEKLLNEKGNN